MAEVFICPTGALTARTVRDLRKVGIVVVETDAPERCQFIRASMPVSADDMLWAALSALQEVQSTSAMQQREAFTKYVFQLMSVARAKAKQENPNA